MAPPGSNDMPQAGAPDKKKEHFIHGLRVHKKTMVFDHKGVYRKGLAKRQAALLKKVEFLQPFLGEHEKILLVTTGCSPISVSEQLMTGWIVFYLKRSLFVFTNRRIIHILTDHRYRYRHSLGQILYGDCKTIKFSWGRLWVKYKNGTKENFLYLHRKERKRIKQLIQKANLERKGSSAGQRHHICPRCATPLQKGRYQCHSCHLEFKDKRRATWLSILFPGGGYFYTGHWFLGLGDMVAEAGLILLAVASLVEPDTAMPDSPAGLAGFGIIMGLLVIEKAITIYHAIGFVNEFIPLKTDFRVSIARQS